MAEMTVDYSLSSKFENRIEFFIRPRMSIFYSWDLGMHLNYTASFLLKLPKTSSEIPTLLLFFPFVFDLANLDSSNGTSSSLQSEAESTLLTDLLADIDGDSTDMVLKPLESIASRVRWSLLDNLVDHGLHKSIHIPGKVILNLFSFSLHLNNIFYNPKLNCASINNMHT